MAKKATTLHDNLGNDLLPVTNASITYMDNGNSVQSEIEDLKLRTQYNKGHYTTEQELLTAYPNGIQNPQLRKGWYAIVGSTDTVWIWDIEGNKWSDSGVSSGGVDSVNGLDGEVILTGGNINATATINDTSKTELINKHLTDIYAELDNKVDLNSSQTITGTKVFTEVIGLANASEGTVDQIKHINSNFLITSGTGQNLLNIDEGLQTISAFNRELAYEDEIAEIQGNYVTNDTLAQELQTVTDMIPTDNSELTNGANYATEQYVQQNGGKIDTISVNGVQQDIINKNVDISVPTDYVTNQQLTDGLNSKQNNLTSSQLQAVNSGANTTNINQITTNSNNINTINSKIPSQASSTNQLADRDFVNSSLNSITAFYITYNVNGDPFPTKSALVNATTYYSGGEVRVPTRNDYAIVLEDESEGNATTRYIYYNQWEYQYTVNETALTADQLSAINSGITSTLVGKISSNEQMINSLAEQVVTDYAQKSELSAFVTTNTAQTINGYKTFDNNISFNSGRGIVYAGDGKFTSANSIFRFGTTSDGNAVMVLANATSTKYLRPGTNGDMNLGVSAQKWKDLYISGKAYIPTLNNGADITVPTTSGTLALTSDIPDTSGFVPNTRTVNGKALSSNISLGSKDVGALPDYTLTINHGTAGNPRMVKFVSVNYSSSATCFKMGAMTCHDNGVSYKFLTDMLIAVTTAGEVNADIYKFAQQEVGSVDGVARYTGDVFYVNDTTNKIVDFYILCGQYSSSQFTPATKVGSTTIDYVTQYSGNATYYSSGDKVWVSGCGTTYARTNEIPKLVTLTQSEYDALSTKDANTYYFIKEE